MRHARHPLLFALAILLLAIPGSAQNWNPAEGSWVTVSGTSTLHDWEVRSETIQGTLTIPAGFLENGSGKVEARVVIPTTSLESHSGRMDRIMYKSLAADSSPEIRFELTEVRPQGKDLHRVAGKLTIAGVTKAIEIDVTLDRATPRALVISGNVPLDMREFGIEPPTAMLGTIRTGEKVTVAFSWHLARR